MIKPCHVYTIHQQNCLERFNFTLSRFNFTLSKASRITFKFPQKTHHEYHRQLFAYQVQTQSSPRGICGF